MSAMDTGMMIALGLLMLYGGILLTNAQECNNDELSRCKTKIQDNLASRSGVLTKKSLESHCKTIQENLDCVVWQTSMCQKADEQDSNSDIIWKAWRYIGSVCDSLSGWWANPCYQREDVKNCGLLFPSTSRAVDPRSCSSYVKFRQCATELVNSKCTTEDAKYLISYLIDKGQDKAWRCSKDSAAQYISSAPLAAADQPILQTSQCIYKVRNDAGKCIERMENKQREALKIEDTEKRKSETCCAFPELKSCIRTVVNDACGQDNEHVVDNFFEAVEFQVDRLCNDFNDKCSKASLLQYSILMLGFFMILFIFI